jgi:hypothetical protein
MASLPYTPVRAERRDLLARALRDMLAERLLCHPRRLGALSAEVVAAMLEETSSPRHAERGRRRRDEWLTPTVVTPAWDSRAG